MIDEHTYGFSKADATELLTRIGSGDREYPEGKVRGGGGSSSILAKTPVGGIAACTGTGPYTFGSATCTIVGTDGVVGSETRVVKNIVNKAIAASVIIKADKVGSIYVVDVASCAT